MGSGGPQGTGRTNAGGHKRRRRRRVVTGGGPYGTGTRPSARRQRQTSRQVARTPVRHKRPRPRRSVGRAISKTAKDLPRTHVRMRTAGGRTVFVPRKQAERILAQSRRMVAARRQESARIGGFPRLARAPQRSRLRVATAGGLDAVLGPSWRALSGSAHAFATSGRVRRETAKGLKNLPAGIIQGTVGLAVHPEKTARALVGQYGHTYGPLVRGDTREFERRLGEKNSGGVLPVALDATLIGTGGSAALGKAAKAGALGPKLEATMRAPRPRLRYSTGRKGTRHQEISPRLGKAVLQRRRDVSRVRVAERRMKSKGNRPLLRSQSVPTAERGVLTGGEVVSRGGLELRARGRSRVVMLPERLRTPDRLQRKDAARLKGQRRILQLDEQAQLDRFFASTAGRRVGKHLGNLSKADQRALRPVYGGLIHATDTKSAIADLRALRREIIDHRKELADQGKLRVRRGPHKQRFNNNVRDIDQLIGHLHRGEVDLPRVQAAARAIKVEEERIARGNPTLEDVPNPGRVSQAELRRYMPQAEILERRGMLPARAEHEPLGSYIERVGLERVQETAEKLGLERPGYFPSERRFVERHGDRAIGGGRGLVDDRTYTGALFRKGEEDWRPEVLLAGLQRGIKRKHNVNLIAEQLERHELPLGATASAERTALRKQAAESKRMEIPIRRRDEVREAEQLYDRAVQTLEDARRDAEKRGVERVAEDPAVQVAYDDLNLSRENLARRVDDVRNEIRDRATGRQQRAADERLAKAAEPGQGRTIKQLLDDIETLHIDPADVKFFNPGRAYRELHEGHVEGTPLPADERFGREGVESGDFSMETVLKRNSGNGDEFMGLLRTNPDAFGDVGGWVAIPKAVGDEILSAAHPSNLTARLFDIAKGKFSRTLLGAGNVSWLAFQVGSNAFLSGIFGRAGPLTWYRAQRWWAGLPDEERAAIRPYLGATAHHYDFERTYLGATAANSTIVNAKRAFEKTAWWQKARRANPIDVMFRMDARQNLFFRRAVLYSEAKRALFDRMGESIGEAARLQDGFTARVGGTLTKSADRKITDYLHDREALERHGQKVDETLGDYLSYTKGERAVMQRVVMFYGFVRHSTRLALWTLPTKHPITTSILGKLALLGAEESREILGGDQLPWGLGKFYWRSGGKIMEIDLARMNPVVNAVTQVQSAEQLASIFPPYVSLAIEQIAEKNLLRGKPWLVRGMTQGIPNSDLPYQDYSFWPDHLKVLTGQLTRTVPFLRYAERITFTGPQGDDASIIFGPRPTLYKDEQVVTSLQASAQRTRAKGTRRRVIETVFPFFPKPSEDRRIVQQRRRRVAGSRGRRRRGRGGSVNEALKSLPKGGGVGDVDKALKSIGR